VGLVSVKTLAVLFLVFWVLGSCVFAAWKKRVAYPERPFAVGFTTTLFELTAAALAIWVLIR
jgi:uncharacterized membrane protein YbhN (UPF0104 family)